MHSLFCPGPLEGIRDLGRLQTRVRKLALHTLYPVVIVANTAIDARVAIAVAKPMAKPVAKPRASLPLQLLARLVMFAT